MQLCCEPGARMCYLLGMQRQCRDWGCQKVLKDARQCCDLMHASPACANSFFRFFLVPDFCGSVSSLELSS